MRPPKASKAPEATEAPDSGLILPEPQGLLLLLLLVLLALSIQLTPAYFTPLA